MCYQSVRGPSMAGLLFSALCCVVGCGGDPSVRVSGKVTFKGQPVPAGKVYFLPDGAKGNKGATGYATIKGGAYDTASAGGQGATSGPVIIAVEGIDPSSPPDQADPSGEVTAKLLFARYEMPADLPKQAATQDIAVPESAAKGPVPPKPKAGVIIP